MPKYRGIPRNGLVLEATWDGSGLDKNDGTKTTVAVTNGTFVNSGAGYSKQCLSLNGSTAYSTITNQASLQLTTLTLCQRIYIPSGVTQQNFTTICSKRSGTTSTDWEIMLAQSVGYGANQGKFLLQHYNGSDIQYFSDARFWSFAGQWVDVCAVIQGTTAQFYFNGVKDSSSFSGTAFLSSANNICIGGEQSPPNANTYFNGYVESFLIYNRVLSEQEIMRIASQGRRGLVNGSPSGSSIPNPVFSASIDGTNSYDSASGVNSTLTGTRKIANSPSGMPIGYSFNGSSLENFGTNSAWSPATAPITIFAEFNLSSLAATTQYVSKYVDGNTASSEFGLQVGSNGALGITGNGVDGFYTSAGFVTSGNWYRVASVVRATGAKVYVDGSGQVATGNITLGSAGSTALCVGAVSSGAIRYYVNGSVSNVAIYPGELTQAQVNLVFASMKAGVPLVGFLNNGESAVTKLATLAYSGDGKTKTGQNPLTIAGTPQLVKNNAAYCNTYDGSTNYGYASYSGTFNPATGGGGTLAAWVKFTTNTSTKIVELTNAANTGFISFIDSITNLGRISYATAGTTLESSQALNDGKWHFIACTHDSNLNGILYVDGRKDATGALGALNIASSYFSVACRWNGSTASLKRAATIGDVWFFNGTVLTGDQIQDLYFSTYRQ